MLIMGPGKHSCTLPFIYRMNMQMHNMQMHQTSDKIQKNWDEENKEFTCTTAPAPHSMATQPAL
jgi:hypothetical protein